MASTQEFVGKYFIFSVFKRLKHDFSFCHCLPILWIILLKNGTNPSSCCIKTLFVSLVVSCYGRKIVKLTYCKEKKIFQIGGSNILKTLHKLEIYLNFFLNNCMWEKNVSQTEPNARFLKAFNNLKLMIYLKYEQRTLKIPKYFEEGLFIFQNQ